MTALAGALAAAMGEMVLAYSVGKKSLQQHAGELNAAAAELHRARQVLLGLMVEDQGAYAAISGVRKLPESSSDRREKEPAALLACIRVPQAMAATAVAVLELCDRLADKVNHHLLSDLAVCAELAMATVRCASYNVRINLNDLSDAADRQSLERATNQMVAHALAIIQRVGPRIWERVGRGG